MGLLSTTDPAWRVLAVFERACDLVTPGGEVIALVWPEVGDGPLNIIVEGAWAGFPAAIEPGMAAGLKGTRLWLGDWEVLLEGAAIWEPCPDWEGLRARREAIAARLPLLQALALSQAPGGSLLTLLQLGDGPDGAAVWPAAERLRAGWDNGEKLARLQAGAARLAGLGGGLTPAGDDFLAGMMVGAWLAHPEPRRFCRPLLKVAAPRTTTLSAALLRAAAGGECSALWHRLLGALADGGSDHLEEAVQGVISCGHTSGADTLAGFLWFLKTCQNNEE